MTIKMPHIVGPADRRASAFIAGAGAARPEPVVEQAAKFVVNMRFDSELLAKIDAAARKHGISRTAWLHVAAAEKLAR
jgi:hypothetical protein